jgi:hypothetical protein
MKVNKRLRDLHEEGNNRYSRLATEVRDMLKPLVEQKGWFFTWRLKELESWPRSRRRPLSATQHHPTLSLIDISWHCNEP